MNKIATLTGYIHEYQNSILNPEAFWGRVAEGFHWRKMWDSTVKWDFSRPNVQWYVGAKLNITENILDRHLYTLGDRTAIIWEPNDPNTKSQYISYRELYHKVCRFANALKAQGIQKGDRVVIYMPMIPDAAVTMLACARIGAVHSVVFAGFSATALRDRIIDCGAKMVITADGSYRGDKTINIKQIVDEAVTRCHFRPKIVVKQYLSSEIEWNSERDVWWHDIEQGMSNECKAEEMDSEDMLFILYTSGSTGKPKGIVHTCGGYMVYTGYSFNNVFQYRSGDIYWCTADIGWITGHSYMIYGPLLCGATTLMFEGIPTYPNPGRFWEVIDRHKVNQFYTAPTAIRSLMSYGTEYINNHKLNSLKVLGSVGEPINTEAWQWYYDHIGKGRCPIVDTWWQTETGGIMIAPLAGIIPTKPSYATMPLPGISPILVDDEGNELKGKSVSGNLCIKFPWPSMLRTIYGDHEKCYETYFQRFKGYYFTGDSALRDQDGYYRILGRVDDVINVSGHRLGTAEVESAISEHPLVIESAVVGFPHEIKGQGIYAFVVADLSHRTESHFEEEVRKTVSNVIGPIAKPDKIVFVPGVPKTRSGKIMRRILKGIAQQEYSQFGDISTLLNPEVIPQIIEKAKAKV